MKKITKLLAALSALIMTVGIVGCQKTTDHPDFINPTDPGSIVETNEKYTINVLSKGGLKLDGVKVEAYNSSGVRVRAGISKNGVINLGIALGEYELRIDEESLPAGYYVEKDVKYTTNPDKREPVDIRIPSKVITQSVGTDIVYNIGDIARDFVIEDYRVAGLDYDGSEYAGDPTYTGPQSYRLSELLETKKAVILNFWYTTCPNCDLEFPYMEKAYATAKDVEILGICLPGYNKAEIKAYVESKAPSTSNPNGFTLSFPLGVDRSQLKDKFSVKGAPTTVIIDRYGMIAYWDEGARPSTQHWQDLFAKYASDEYVQDVTPPSEGGEGGGGSSSDNRIEPDVEMPSSEKMAQAGSAANVTSDYAEDEDVYSWPWTVGTDNERGSVIVPTNSGKGNTYSIVHVTVDLKEDEGLAFDYKLDTEKDSDVFYVMLDEQALNGYGWSGSTGWETEEVFVADRDMTVKLSFIYMKDYAQDDGEDTVKIDNIRTYDVKQSKTPLDVMRRCATGTPSQGKYEFYKTVVKGDDGFYHIDTADGPLLYICINNITAWSELHTKDNHIITPNDTVYASLYLMTNNLYTVDDADNHIFDVILDGTDYGDVVMTYFHLLDALEAPYFLMPVNDQLKGWAQAFVKEYSKDNNYNTHDNEWLEFCSYYDHYGAEHAEGENCKRYEDFTKGLSVYNRFEIGFENVPANGERMGMVTANVNHPLERPNALYYEFTAPKNGVYQIRDYLSNDPLQLETAKIGADGVTVNTISFSDSVRDFDSHTGTRYGNFNEYVVLKEGEKICLEFIYEAQKKGSFQFDITYHESVDKLFDCTTGDGAWTWVETPQGVDYIYLGVQVAFDTTTNRYYRATRNGTPDYDKPVYINMIYESFIINGVDNNLSLEEIIEKGRFSEQDKTVLLNYLTKSTEGKETTDPMYGLVEANQEIVTILSNYIKANDDAAGGDGRGWLAFAAYMEHIA